MKLRCWIFGHRFMPIMDLQEKKTTWVCTHCLKKGKVKIR